MDNWFYQPTVSDERPPMTNLPAYPDFTLTLSGNEWRQAEFINISKLCVVGEEVDEIKEIRINHSREFADGIRSYHRLHVRRHIGAAELYIPLFELKSLLRCDALGSVAMDYHHGFVKNGFALNTPSGYFYGREENGVVKSLAVFAPAGLPEREIARIVRTFSLIYVHWCNCNILTP